MGNLTNTRLEIAVALVTSKAKPGTATDKALVLDGLMQKDKVVKAVMNWYGVE